MGRAEKGRGEPKTGPAAHTVSTAPNDIRETTLRETASETGEKYRNGDRTISPPEKRKICKFIGFQTYFYVDLEVHL